MSHQSRREFRLAPLSAAVLALVGSAYAQTSPEVLELTTPQSELSVGVGAVNSTRDAKRFGQYTGMNQSASVLLDFEMIRRNDTTGFWTTFTGRNIGLESRELSFSQQLQGDWRYAVDYNEIVRYDPYVINTGMTGIGSTTPTINLIQRPAMSAAWAAANGYAASNGIAGSEAELKLKRSALGFTGEKWISPELQMELSFRNEQKNGARMFGRVGITSSDMKFSPTTNGNVGGNGALLLTPEPIDSVIRTFEAKINFNRGGLALSGGYYGSFYINNNGSLNPVVPGTLNRGALWSGGAGCASLTTACSIQQIASSAVALSPDNQAHQLYLSGTYAITPTTRTNFKLSYTHATQDESYAGMGLQVAPGGPASLGGVVDTTLAQVGLTTRPSKDLSVNASLRYEDRADRTAVNAYNFGSSAALNGTTNWASGSQTRTTAKVDGIYRLTGGYSLNLGMDWERKVTPLPPSNTAIFNNQVFFRSSLDEYGIHAGIRKALSDTLNGSLSYEAKSRRGDDNGWVTTTGTAGNGLLPVNPALANNVLADMYMDRDRTKVRGTVDWAATEKLSVEAVLEHGQDLYNRNAPVVAAQLVAIVAGARDINMDSLTLDASYAVSDDWKLNGYWTHSENGWKVNKISIGDDTRNKTDTFGLGIKGKIGAKLSVGMDVVVTNDVTTFSNVVATSNVGGIGNIAGNPGQPFAGNFLPNINYNTTKVKLSGTYDIDKKSAVQANLIVQKFDTNDWQWGYNGVPYIYSDNTTVSNPNQSLTFLGISYLYKF